jgi:hypothetical protein
MKREFVKKKAGSLLKFIEKSIIFGVKLTHK